MTTGRLRFLLPLLGLAAALIVIDLFVWGPSALRVVDPMSFGRRFRSWHVEDEQSPAVLWKVAKAMAIAVTLSIVALRRRAWWPLPWALLFANLGLVMGTHYQNRIGDELAELTGISSGSRWGLLLVALVTGGLVVIGIAGSPQTWATAQLFVIVVALLGLAAALDFVGDDVDGRRRELAVIHLESAAELGMLTIALVHAVHLARTPPNTQAG
ncbi:MAG: hypothetical protein AAGE98_22255 [Actinomycetota bacterium]